MANKTIPQSTEATSSQLPDSFTPTMMGTRGLAFSVAVVTFIGILGLGGLSAMGSSLNLTAHAPDLSAAFLSVDYNATTGIISADGFPASFNLSGTSIPDYAIEGGQYKLSAQVTPAGQPVTGSLNITGTIPSLATSGTLLTGQLSQFGFQATGGDIFEFIFNVTGGDLAPYYNGKTGVILTATGSGFNGSFANDFTAPLFTSASDNTIVVPEPSTAVLLLSMFFGIIAQYGISVSRRDSVH